MSDTTNTGTSQVNQTDIHEYDNKDFDITNGAQAGETLLAPSDGSMPPARIASTARGKGNRYQLDPKNTGNAGDYTQGPIIGEEADRLDAALALPANNKRLPSPIHALARNAVVITPTTPAPASTPAPAATSTPTVTSTPVASISPAATHPTTIPGEHTPAPDPNIAVSEHLAHHAGVLRVVIEGLRRDLGVTAHWSLARIEDAANALEHLAKRV